MTGICDFLAMAGRASASSWLGQATRDDVAARRGRLGDLLQRRVDVGGGRRAHRLHGDGGVAADPPPCRPDLPCLAPRSQHGGRGRGHAKRNGHEGSIPHEGGAAVRTRRPLHAADARGGTSTRGHETTTRGANLGARQETTACAQTSTRGTKPRRTARKPRRASKPRRKGSAAEADGFDDVGVDEQHRHDDEDRGHGIRHGQGLR